MRNMERILPFAVLSCVSLQVTVSKHLPVTHYDGGSICYSVFFSLLHSHKRLVGAVKVSKEVIGLKVKGKLSPIMGQLFHTSLLSLLCWYRQQREQMNNMWGTLKHFLFKQRIPCPAQTTKASMDKRESDTWTMHCKVSSRAAQCCLNFARAQEFRRKR